MTDRRLETLQMSRTWKYRRTYQMLKDYGHSPTKAAEIVLDASRGVRSALQWIRLIHNKKKA